MAEATKDQRARYSLIGLIAMRRARAEHERKTAEDAKNSADASDQPRVTPRRRRWFG